VGSRPIYEAITPPVYTVFATSTPATISAINYEFGPTISTSFLDETYSYQIAQPVIATTYGPPYTNILNWTVPAPAANPPVTTYKVYEGNTFQAAVAGTTSNTTLTVNNQPLGTITYTVQALNQFGIQVAEQKTTVTNQ
jgi:hypothetical protein